jgi:hypothetical protein
MLTVKQVSLLLLCGILELTVLPEAPRQAAIQAKESAALVLH